MTERYSLSDRQVYGAEDDFEMDMILAAIDRALEDPKPAELTGPVGHHVAPMRDRLTGEAMVARRTVGQESASSRPRGASTTPRSRLHP